MQHKQIRKENNKFISTVKSKYKQNIHTNNKTYKYTREHTTQKYGTRNQT